MGRNLLNRRAVEFRAPETVSIVEETVECGAGELAIETDRSAISAGTELLIYRGEVPGQLSADTTIDALDGDLSYPLRYGYAGAGEVVAQGESVEGLWEGRRVFSFHPHASHMIASPDAVVPIPDDVDNERASMLPSVETALAIAQDANPEVGARVLIFGAGVIGILTSMLLAAMPLMDVVIVDPSAERRATAGATAGVTAVHPDATAEMAASFDLGVELSGDPRALDQCIRCMRYDADVVVGSWYGNKDAHLDLGAHYHRNHITIRSSQVSKVPPNLRGRWGKERRLDTAMQAIRDLPVGSLISHRIHLDDAAEAYTRLADGDASMLQVLLTYDT